MNISSEHIKKALVQIAERLGRPHYEHCVVVAVMHAIKHDEEHHLKSLVLSEKIVLPISPIVFLSCLHGSERYLSIPC